MVVLGRWCNDQRAEMGIGQSRHRVWLCPGWAQPGLAQAAQRRQGWEGESHRANTEGRRSEGENAQG